MAKVTARKVVAFLLALSFWVSAVTEEEETCHASDHWCVGKRRRAETLLQSSKMQVTAKRLAAEDTAEQTLLPPRRVPRQTMLVAQTKHTRQGASGRTCVPVGIETMRSAPSQKVHCDNELQCNVAATQAHNVGAYEGDFARVIDKDTEWPVKVTESFGSWPYHAAGVVIGVMVGHSHGTGTLLDTRVIRLDPSASLQEPLPVFEITFEVTQEGELIVSFPQGPFIGDTMRFPKDAWLLEYPCPGGEEVATPSPTVAPDVCLSKNAKFDWAGVKVIENNLGGQGPNAQSAEAIRYRSFLEQDGKKVDLVVTSASPYQRSGNNGLSNQGRKFGSIAVSEGTSVDLLFSFQDQETQQPVVVDVLHMTFFDFDGTKDTTEEIHVDVGQLSAYIVDQESGISVSIADDGRAAFKSSAPDVPNPEAPLTLSAEQQKRTVMFVFEGKSSFAVTLNAPCTGTCSKGRTFFFADDSSLSAQCSQ